MNRSALQDSTHLPCVPLVRAALDALHEHSLEYCHFKSNEHLDASLMGKTDLDILFKPGSQQRVTQVLRSCGFELFRTVRFRKYPHIFDYVGIDNQTGALIHIHAHFALIVGETGVKSFHLPWEDRILATRFIDSASGMYVIRADLELLLLLVRCAIKCKYPEPLKRGAGPSFNGVSDDVREFFWLQERVSANDLELASIEFMGAGACASIRSIYFEGLSRKGLLDLYRDAAGYLGGVRRYSRPVALVLRWYRRIAPHVLRLTAKAGIHELPNRRTISSGGLIVAVLGSDGSGKSTLIGGLQHRLGAKIDLLHVYLGSGEGKSSLLRWPLVAARNVARNSRKASAQVTHKLVPARKPGFAGRLASLFDIAWALTLAWEKRAKLKRAVRARRRGIVVIADRYPQNQVLGYNDGPLLGSAATGYFLKHLAQYEGGFYHDSAVPRPDLVLKLQGSLEEISRRRPEMAKSVLLQKQEAVQSIGFSSATRVVVLNADNSPEEVLSAAAAEIGRLISERLQQRCDG